MQMYIYPSDEDIRKDWEKAEENMKFKNRKRDGSDTLIQHLGF